MNTIKKEQRANLTRNTVTSLTLQLVTILSGFILPRMVLVAYGSETNGLINSIKQFLQIISFLELGVGAVVQSALYYPIAMKDETKLSEIVVSAKKFFRTIGIILLIYVALLMIIYPKMIGINYFDVAILIGVMSVSAFCQYMFGLVDGILLTADQKGYVYYSSQIITIILNTVISVIFINLGMTIQEVKFFSALVYIIRPFLVRIYVNKRYNINYKIKYNGEPIRQKWNGVAQHVSYVILESTDIIVLTLFSDLKNVSIYSVYYLVVNGIKQLINSLSNGIPAVLGELWAKKSYKELSVFFEKVEWIIHNFSTVIWGCTFVLICPFISIYTKGISDNNYYAPLFAAIICLANMLHSLRIPYNVMILAAGHYKETQKNYIISALVNIFISILMVYKFGLVGVAIGTFCAMIYQTLWMAIYVYKNLINIKFYRFFKQSLIDICVFIIIVIISKQFATAGNYIEWIILAVKVVVISLGSVLITNFLFYRKKILNLFNNIKKRMGI